MMQEVLTLGSYFALLFLFAAAGTAWVTRYALGRQMLDVPNERSSHSRPTPRGGGLAIALVCLFGWTGGALFGIVDGGPLLWLICGSGIIAAIGFLDDRQSVRASRRIAVHLCAAAAVSWYAGGVNTLQVGGQEWSLGWAGYAVAIIGVTWVLNLFNFMDGIDGLAASEAAFVSFSAALLLWFADSKELAFLSATLGVASSGFLVWNWAPAKIFMGDIGSGFLGFSLAALGLFSHSAGVLSVWVWLVLLGVFVVDATFTLLRRLVNRQPVYQAHRSHAYQHAAVRLRSHGRVSSAVLAVNTLWLLPIAAGIGLGYLDGAVGLLIAYLPLVVLAVYYGAGKAAEDG